MPTIKTLTVVLVSVAASACQQDVSSAIDKEHKEITALQEKVNALQSDVKTLQVDAQFSRFVQTMDGVAILHPGDGGYSVIKFDLGYMTVALDDVRAFANGSKVTLRFGNPLGADINGLNGKIQCGPTDKDGTPDWDHSTSKEFKEADTVPSASWKKVTIVVDGMPPNKIGFVRISDLTNTGIRLLVR